MFLEVGNAARPKVLIVDDESSVVESLADLLRKDFHVLGTTDAEKALDLLRGQDVALILADQRMPTMTGSELLARAVAISPDTVRVLITAYSDIEAVILAVNDGHVYHYLKKPWNPGRLMELVQSATQHYALVAENHRLVLELARLESEMTSARTHVSALVDRQVSLQQENRTLHDVYEQLKNSFWHLKKIQEVLPICMECGKVKSTATSWESVVEYLKKNSLFLSHGYCPECAERAAVRFGLQEEDSRSVGQGSLPRGDPRG